ncbi:MAG: AzlD domain-containing protein [Deltaproteobacteria bacterium]|nr:AzlD domain-containing protein [Deltaproteobacteria bacterium]
MIERDYILVVLGMGVVTYVPRLVPLLFLSRRALPRWFTEWLEYIPAAILSALILPLLLTTGVPRHLDVTTPELLVAIPTFLVALKTRSLAGTVLAGMFLYWLAGQFL